MTKIAIVGNIASGKSTVEKILKDKGFTVYDTDKIAHEILEDNKHLFPHAIVDGKIDRKKLANIVFNDKEQLKFLESVIHPKVKEFIENINDTEIVFVSVPQLFEAGMEDLFDKIIFVSVPTEIRIERLMKRNNLTKEEALIRINAQMSENVKISKSDFVIVNDKTEEELKLQILHLFDYKS
ncbi:MAG: dephospho-CoA kinase [Candidatus Gastranaerophilales bacterium]|nr:dephospho-CoA kinase [Candidatus Gastranaerophilales bacterium]MCM1073089.1 dephospho-CoA kinase [Bacteroides sp.]